MASSYNTLINSLYSFMNENGRYYSEFYVGITNDIERRLFNEHNVDNGYIYDEAYSDDVARKVEQYFLDKGCKGDTGGGSEDSTYVYSYKITRTTVQ